MSQRWPARPRCGARSCAGARRAARWCSAPSWRRRRRSGACRARTPRTPRAPLGNPRDPQLRCKHAYAMHCFLCVTFQHVSRARVASQARRIAQEARAGGAVVHPRLGAPWWGDAEPPALAAFDDATHLTLPTPSITSPPPHPIDPHQSTPPCHPWYLGVRHARRLCHNGHARPMHTCSLCTCQAVSPTWRRSHGARRAS